MKTSVLATILLFLTASGCKSDETLSGAPKGSPEAEKPVTPLPKAPNGAPISVEFKGFTDHESRRIKVRLFNTGEKQASGYVLVVRFRDEADALLPVRKGTAAEAPSAFMSFSGAANAVDPGKDHHLTIEGIAVPAKARRAEVIASRVETHKDGDVIKWFSQKRWSQWPKDSAADTSSDKSGTQ